MLDFLLIGLSFYCFLIIHVAPPRCYSVRSIRSFTTTEILRELEYVRLLGKIRRFVLLLKSNFSCQLAWMRRDVMRDSYERLYLRARTCVHVLKQNLRVRVRVFET